MILLRQSFVVVVLIATSTAYSSHAFSQSATDFRAAAVKAFPATVAVSSGNADENSVPGRNLRSQSQERLRSMLRPGDRSIMLFRNEVRFPSSEPSAAGVAIAPDLVIVAKTGVIDEVVRLNAAGHKNIQGKIVVNDYVIGLSVVRLDQPILAPLAMSERPLEPGQPVLMTEVSELGEANAHSAMIASFATASSPELGMVHRLDTSLGDIASGSPLVDENGDFVGLAILASSGVVCLPTARFVRLIETAQSESPADLLPGRLGIVLGGSGDTLVTELVDDSPAGKAGLEPGDRIASVGGQPTTTTAEVIAAIAMHRGGDTVELVAVRGEKETQHSVVLDTDKSQYGKMPSIHPSQMWRLENGKLVPMDEKLSGELRKGLGQLMPNTGQLNLGDPIVISPPELRGITVERSGLDEAMQAIQRQLEQTQEHQRDIAEKLRQLKTPLESNKDEKRSGKPDSEQSEFDKLQRLLESLQEEIQSLKADRG